LSKSKINDLQMTLRRKNKRQYQYLDWSPKFILDLGQVDIGNVQLPIINYQSLIEFKFKRDKEYV
jgi:hypothetical protein